MGRSCLWPLLDNKQPKLLNGTFSSAARVIDLAYKSPRNIPKNSPNHAVPHRAELERMTNGWSFDTAGHYLCLSRRLIRRESPKSRETRPGLGHLRTGAVGVALNFAAAAAAGEMSDSRV